MSRVVTLPPDEPLLADGTRLGGWWHDTGEQNRLVCDLCPRACTLKPGDRGFCFVRENRDGRMVLSTYGRSTGFCIDPIEKKPLNHFYPGTSVLSFGTAGCNLGCKFCQNWDISKSREIERLSESATPEAIAAAAHELGCRSVAFTYNDPVIWAEYAIDVARACHARQIKTVAVTAGYITPLARGPFFEVMDAANVDLKGFTEEFYQHLTLSHLQPVLETLRWLKHETDVWFEITNLVIPQANDSDDEFRQMCQWILEHLGDEVPVHFTAFHPDFRLRDRDRTPPQTLVRAREIACRAGIKYAYVGNVDDVAHQSTFCPHCGKLVIERNWYDLGAYHLDGNCCRHCGGRIAGHFDAAPGDWGRRRLPVQISQYAGQGPVVDTSQKGNTVMSTVQRSVEFRGEPDVCPDLSKVQERSVHRAACELVAAATMGCRAEVSDPTLAGAAARTVVGCFVTIKRQGRLRACCGFVGKHAMLDEAIEDAALTTATRDTRLPSISPTELEYLDLSVSLLHSLRPITARGEARLAEVHAGRHGLQIARGEARGVLLPSVATENDWDALRFLEQVCLKAGLPPSAWREEDTRLATFEGLSISGPFDSAVAELAEIERPPLVHRDDITRLATLCRENVVALVARATPTYYLAECSDGTVQGVSVRLEISGRDEKLHFSQLSIRPGLPLQATLMDLAKMAAGVYMSQGFYADELAGLCAELTVLYDPAMHGTVAEPDLRGLQPQRRALLVMEEGKSAWVFDPTRAATELLEDAAREAKVRAPRAATVNSLAAVSTSVPVTVANIPKPQAGPALRPPAVAGAFYPQESQELSRMVDDLLGTSQPPKRPWKAAMVPHAGLKYSGRIAAAVLQRIEMPDTIIILGPKHTRQGVEWAVAPHETWSWPGLSLPADPKLASELCAAIPDLELDALAHAGEHAVEVELPLIGRLAPQAHVVGIVVGGGNYERCCQFATGLANVLRTRGDRTLLVISSDMNHFASDDATRRLDEMALSAITRLDPRELFDTVRTHHISMCGVLPAVIVLEALRQLGQLKKCHRIGYATSGDVTGDRSRVVGYAGLLFE